MYSSVPEAFTKTYRNDTHVDQQVQREIGAILQTKTWQCISKFAYLSLGISSLNKTQRWGGMLKEWLKKGAHCRQLILAKHRNLQMSICGQMLSYLPLYLWHYTAPDPFACILRQQCIFQEEMDFQNTPRKDQRELSTCCQTPVRVPRTHNVE